MPYTEIAYTGNVDLQGIFVGKTSVVRNPANTAGLLRFYSLLPCSTLAPATPNGFSATMTVVKLNSNGTIAVNDKQQTSHKKYFAAGDAVSGGQEVVNAVADGKKAAKGIKDQLLK